jgi:hypothetical protein
VTLLRRGAARITPYAVDPPHRIDVAGLVAYARRLADEIEAGGGELTVPRLRR